MPSKPCGFYGRQDEQNRLAEIFTRARWFFVKVAGRRRIGKTTLVQQALRPDQRDRVLVLAFLLCSCQSPNANECCESLGPLPQSRVTAASSSCDTEKYDSQVTATCRVLHALIRRELVCVRDDCEEKSVWAIRNASPGRPSEDLEEDIQLLKYRLDRTATSLQETLPQWYEEFLSSAERAVSLTELSRFTGRVFHESFLADAALSRSEVEKLWYAFR